MILSKIVVEVDKVVRKVILKTILKSFYFKNSRDVDDAATKIRL